MLQRAQQLYDAPVHLLYVARAQVKLGNLVEGAETYRRLERVQLEAGAPKAFKDAVAVAGKELSEVEPRLPALRLDVDPPGVNGLEIRIDGEPVPAAVVGIDRPLNPGEHKVEVWAPGHSKAEANVALAEGERKRIELKLVPGEGPPPAGVTPGAGPSSGVPADQPARGDVEPKGTPSKIGFLVGLRLGGAIPTGTAFVDSAGNEVPISEEFGGGGGIELHAGVRFMKYFTGVLFIEGYSLKPGSRLDELPEIQNEPTLEVQSTPIASGGGLAVIVGTERGRFGGFGELGFAPIHNFTINRDIDISGVGVRCSQTVTLSGAALRIGGGLSIPVADFLSLTPYVMATLGSFRDAESETDCPDTDPTRQVVEAFTNSHEIGDTAGHQLLVLGVGGDFLLGRDKPVE
jgi:hypothetical protein